MTAEPLIDRRTFIGGSDIAAILGISPWSTPYQLWCEKTASAIPEPDPKREAIFRRGKRLEPFVIDWAREEYELDIITRNARYQDAQAPHFSCEIDFEHQYEGSMENADAKTVHFSKSKEWGEPGTDEIPQYYTAQFLWGQMVTGRDSTLVMALFSMDKMVPYRVRRDEGVITWMRERAERFWESVERREPPEITTLEDAKLRWSREVGTKQVEATGEIAEMVERLRLMRAGIAGDEAKASLLELDLKRYIGDAEELVDGNGDRLASWKTQRRKAYTVRESESRVLRLSGRE